METNNTAQAPTPIVFQHERPGVTVVFDSNSTQAPILPPPPPRSPSFPRGDNTVGGMTPPRDVPRMVEVNTDESESTRETPAEAVQGLTHTADIIAVKELMTIPQSSLRAFVKGIVNFKPREVRVLDFAFNQMTDLVAQELLPLLSTKTIPKLQVLDLRNNRLTSPGLIQLAKPLQKRINVTLEIIRLNQNEIGDKGALALCVAARNHPTLREVHLSHNYVTDAGAGYFLHLVEQNSRISLVDISNNRVSSSLLRTLNVALQTSKDRRQSPSTDGSARHTTTSVSRQGVVVASPTTQSAPRPSSSSVASVSSSIASVVEDAPVHVMDAIPLMVVQEHDEHVMDAIPHTHQNSLQVPFAAPIGVTTETPSDVTTTTTTNIAMMPGLVTAEADDMSEFMQDILAQNDELCRENARLRMELEELRRRVGNANV